MRKFLLRLATTVVVAAGMAVVAASTAGVSSAECDAARPWNPVTRMCDPPPPVPAWYQVAPAWAQSWAPAWAPPPPPAPDWAVQYDLKPVWDPKLNTWTWIYVR